MIFKGSCHCGRVAFEVEGEIAGAMACNCSICSRKGSLLWFVLPPEEIFPLISDLRSMQTWSAWEKVDPGMKRTYSGAATGKGAVYEWEQGDW